MPHRPVLIATARAAAVLFLLLLLCAAIESRRVHHAADDEGLINRPKLVDAPRNILHPADKKALHSHRIKRYTGILSKRFKLNRRYQECVGPGEVQGHCKHVVYCPMDVVGISSKSSLDYLCIIEKMHVGVCCPDDILLRSLTGAQVIMDLPASGDEYGEEDANTGCGLMSLARPASGSRNTPAKRWPWLAALFKPTIQKQQFCGGAVITDVHILTAAHCFENLRNEDIRVRLGEYDFRRADETRSRDFAVVKIIKHEEYNQATYEHDIAILTLDRSATFNSYMWPICLPPLNRTYEGETVTVAGWGQQAYMGPTSDVLLEVTMPVWPQIRCVDAFAQRISDNNLCAAAYEGGKDSCLGDSGGPLVYQLENGRWVAIGIVSWGIGCGNKDQPGIYTRVDKYIPWIVRNTIVK
ncbi:coagulation factor IX-like [Atheta coriaria]|uniref:coagulation factor IX-like n=1 Tax=Dalotia coriaria TaxID=877792 RepID=UPI0031F358A0